MTEWPIHPSIRPGSDGFGLPIINVDPRSVVDQSSLAIARPWRRSFDPILSRPRLPQVICDHSDRDGREERTLRP